MNATELFRKIFKLEPAYLASAPGRLEILGNHTDYNEGLVLSAAVSQKTDFAMSPVKGRICRIVSNMDESIIEIDLDRVEEGIKKGCWSTYIKGVICEIRKRGADISAFDAAVTSTVPLSAGMSSSAALEVSALFAFQKAFGLKFSKTDLAKIGQGAENNFVGVQSGLLDQFSSIYGKKNSLILCDFRTNEVVKTVPVPEGYVIAVVNSMVRHTLVDSDYNVRRKSCENAVARLKETYPEIKALRDVTTQMLEKAKDALDFVDYKRALHIVGEDERVLAAVKTLDKSDIKSFGKILFESHESSRRNFENSCPELDYLIELSMSLPGCVGARLSGGGFGGISIHFVENAKVEEYSNRISTAYKLRTGIETVPILCELGDGAEVKTVIS